MLQKVFFHVFIETATFPELKTVFSFTIDPLGAEKTPVLFGILNLYSSLQTLVTGNIFQVI